MDLYHITIAQELEGRTIVPEIHQVRSEEHIDASKNVGAALKDIGILCDGNYHVEKALFRCELHEGKIWYRVDLHVISHDREHATK